jgi:hypothetical protein
MAMVRISIMSKPGFALWNKAKKDFIPFYSDPRTMPSISHEIPRPKITKHRGREEGGNETNIHNAIEKHWQREVATFVASDTSLEKTTKTTFQQSTNVGASSRIGYGTNHTILLVRTLLFCMALKRRDNRIKQ